MDQSYVIGIDVGGTNTKYGIVDRRGQIVKSGSIKTGKHEDVNNYLDESSLERSNSFCSTS